MRLLCFLFATFLTLGPAGGAQADVSSPLLPDIIANAQTSDPALSAARARLEATKEQYPQALSGWRPSLRAETSIYATDIDSSNFTNGTGATTKDLTLSVDQPIFRGGQTFAETARARDLIRAATYNVKAAEQSAYLDTALIYMDVIRTSSLLTLRMQNEQRLQQELTMARERFTAGELTRPDVDQARANLSRARADTLAARGEYQATTAAFQEQTGLVLPKVFYYPKPDWKLPATLNDALAQLNNKSPTLQAAKFEHRAANHAVDDVRRELYPQFGAFASLNKQYDPQPGIIADSQVRTVGVRANMPFYEGGATRSRLRAARSEAQGFEYDIRDTARSLRRDLRDNWENMMAARREINIRREEIKFARNAAEGVNVQARMGERTLRDLLLANQDILEAETALIQARQRAVAAEYTIAALLGLLGPQ